MSPMQGVLWDSSTVLSEMDWSLVGPGTEAMGKRSRARPPSGEKAQHGRPVCSGAGVTMNLICIAHLDQAKDLNEILAT